MNNDKTRYLIAGGAGFIGVNFVRMLAADPDAAITVVDKLTYAGCKVSLQPLIDRGRIEFVEADIADASAMSSLLEAFDPHYIINFAAESHVDRCVDNPQPFIDSNIVGAFTLLDCARRRRAAAPTSLQRYLQVSTDEVYGDLAVGEPVHVAEDVCMALGRDAITYGLDSFNEESPVRPSSPYSAAKASADMLVLSYARTFGMPVIVTRCSNNYGPYQYPEKLIPLALRRLMAGEKVPVYGRGLNVRDWIYVDDHCRGILAALYRGRIGQVYNFGGYSEMHNIDLVRLLISGVNAFGIKTYGEDSFEYVGDRPGHDLRYAIDARKAINELGWVPQVDFNQGIARTIRWYIDNPQWPAEPAKETE